MKVEEDSQFYQVQKFIKKRKVKTGVQYLIKWKGYPLNQSTWEPEKHLKHLKEDIWLCNQKTKRKNIARPVTTHDTNLRKRNLQRISSYLQHSQPSDIHTYTQRQRNTVHKAIVIEQKDEQKKQEVYILQEIMDEGKEVFIIQVSEESRKFDYITAVLLFPEAVCSFYRKKVEKILLA